METNTFKFCEIVTDHPHLSMFDGHLIHISASVIEKALKENIILEFPQHATDVLQPLYVACLGPLKREWERRLLKHISEYGIKQQLFKSEFTKELRAICNTGMKRDSVISGFEAAGTVFKISNVIRA